MNQSTSVEILSNLVQELASIRINFASVGAVSDAVGAGLLFARFSQIFGSRKYAEAAAQIVDCLIEDLPNRFDSESFYSGFPGTIWAIESISRSLSAQGATDLDSTDCDQLVLDVVRARGNRMHFDVVNGLVGLGVYGLSRTDPLMASKITGEILNSLEEQSETVARGRLWRTRADRVPTQTAREASPQGWFDLGVAHGSAGVVAYLASVVRRDSSCTRSRRLLREATAGLIEQGNWSRERGIFPYVVGNLDGSRAAWCYGDPGIAIALFKASSVLDDQYVQTMAERVAASFSRTRIEHSEVVDASLCHGTAGLAHIAQRLASYSINSPAWFQLADYWLHVTITSMRDANKFCGGFYYYDPSTKQRQDDRSLLQGATGVGLVLCDAISYSAADWHHLLLTD